MVWVFASEAYYHTTQFCFINCDDSTPRRRMDRAGIVKVSCYIEVALDGKLRMVRTIKRANADDRWKVVSQKDHLSAADLESAPAEFTCSRGTREKSILLRSVWRGIRLTLSHRTQIMTQSRGGSTSSREISWRMGRRIAARIAEHCSVVAVHRSHRRMSNSR